MTYKEFISQFEVFDGCTNPRKGVHIHHIIPKSVQKKRDERHVFLLPSQHLWAHILYDQENGTNTAAMLIGISGLRKKDIHSYEDCLPFDKSDELWRKHRSETHDDVRGLNNPMFGKTFHHTDKAKQAISKNNGRYWLGKKRNTPAFNTRGLHWFNDGQKEVMGKDCPEGFRPGRMRKSV